MAVTVNSTTFPDANFRNYVLQNITGGSTTLTDEKINSRTGIVITNEANYNKTFQNYMKKCTFNASFVIIKKKRKEVKRRYA